MKAFVYSPTNENDINELQKNVAKVHAEAVINYINKLSAAKSDKMKLVKAISEKQ